ncbi:MAG: hypothetical protein JXA71_16315 [Chitinispirillaceae bacterium]|nr:hypothetical protein [Chitinispirillaceae bacterium]
MTKQWIVIALALLVCFCTPPVRDYLEKQQGSVASADSTAIDSSGALQADSVVTRPPPPSVVEIESWPGERFILREKPALYCSYGYELYTCPKLDSCRGVVDTAVETKRHRVKCGVFDNAAFTVTSVEPRGAEWLVVFRHEATDRALYARTVAGELPEFSYGKDLDGARKRWVGATVYPARGFIFTIDSSAITTVKVRIQDPLKVFEVRVGTTPLPAKSLWLMVETADGRKGVIPLYYSWTNVKKELRHEGNAWDDDIHEENPAAAFHADSATWEMINVHHVRQGMTRDQVRLSWGRPVKRETGAYQGAERECWVYENQRLWFDEKELVAIEEAGGRGK